MTSTALSPGGEPYPSYLIEGTDPGLVSQELTTLLNELVGIDETSITTVEEYGGGGEEGAVIGPALDACRTPPFFAPRRIVVVRDAAALDASQVADVASYLADPLDTAVLVLVHVGRSAPAALTKAVKARGHIVSAVPAATNRARSQWFSERLRDSSVRLDHEAATMLQEHLGEDLPCLEGTIATLESAYGQGTTVHAEDLEPFLGTAGGVAPWDLTDALDRGESNVAIASLHRLLSGTDRHPLQVLAVLHRHYGAMLRLDGADVTDDQGAAAATGLSPFPAKKALAQCRRLGHERVVRAVQLLADADLDVRGRSGWPPDLVLEVLVARLAQLARLRATTSGRGARSRGHA